MAGPDKAPSTLSSETVACMINLFDAMYRARGPLGHRLYDFGQLSTTLFGMGFDNEFLSACEHGYNWEFRSLLPAMYDGSFYGNRIGAGSRGQRDLRRLATLLCGAPQQYPELRRTWLNIFSPFEKSLLRDGYEFDGISLVEVGLDTSVVPELSKLPD